MNGVWVVGEPVVGGGWWVVGAASDRRLLRSNTLPNAPRSQRRVQPGRPDTQRQHMCEVQQALVSCWSVFGNPENS